jgi:FAD-dependent urate hydroxylase
VPGLHFVGAPAAESFGPIMRFVSGTPFTGRALAEHIARTRRPAPVRSRPYSVPA